MRLAMSTLKAPLSFAGLCLALLGLFGCNLLSPASPSPAPLPPVSSAPGEAALEQPVASRSYIDLDGYQISYTRQVQGTLDGIPYESLTRIARRQQSQPRFEDWIVESQGPGADISYYRYILHQGAHYFQGGIDSACRAGQPGGMLVDPAALLPVVGGVQSDRTELVNGIQAAHYPIDGRAIGLAPGMGSASGEMWLAESGHYVVKYVLEIHPADGSSAVGLQAYQSIHFELSLPDQPGSFELPPSCIPVLTGIPALPDASDVENRSAYLSYTTQASREAVIDFYNRELDGLGWQVGEPPEQDPQASPSYFKYGSLLNLLLGPTEGGLRVTLLLSDPKYMSALPPSDPSELEGLLEQEGQEPPGPAGETALPEDLTGFGLPAGVPVYPGAFQLQPMGEMGVLFLTPDSADQVRQFYQEQLAGGGWEMQEGMGAYPGAPIVWEQGNSLLMMNIQEGELSLVSLILMRDG
jgi:hypothetical protein